MGKHTEWPRSKLNGAFLLGKYGNIGNTNEGV
jgi:hypothetical protein